MMNKVAPPTDPATIGMTDPLLEVEAPVEKFNNYCYNTSMH